MNCEQELQKALETKRELELLLDNKGWRRAVSLVQVQVDGLQRDILNTPCTSLDSTLSQEYKKGQLEGRLCLSALVETELESCEVTINNLRRQINERIDDTNGGSTGTSNPSGSGNAP